MTLSDLTAALDALGVRLSARLVVDAPRGALSEELKAALVAHKPSLLARLAGLDTQPLPEHVAAPAPEVPAAGVADPSSSVPAPSPVAAEPTPSFSASCPPSVGCSRFCRTQGRRWWRSIHGVYLCWNCRPPAVPELVAESGGSP